VKSPREPFAHEGAPIKPRIVLVDDHPDVLKSLSRMLSFDFEVLGTASDGYQAVDLSQRLDPDLVLLDITMPGRDGFQTARDLQERGTRARIVFLTMHESNEFVAEGFRSGGRGYVLKTRLHLDLVSALKRVFAGQLFVPSLRSLFAIDANSTGHVAQFYSDEYALVDEMSAFLGAALRRGDAVSVVSTGPIRAALAERLLGYGWNVGASGEYGRYRGSDSVAAASSVLRNGRLIPGYIESYVAGLERWRVTVAGPGSRLTLVGDIATQLLFDGNSQAALEVEHQWSDATRALPFFTVCCYPMTPLSDDRQVELLPQVCAEHFAVAHTPEGGMSSTA
jgi:DNA-binding NarL/FixJ family response regulator